METLRGVVDVMLGREDGLSRIDLSEQGFWLSFFGIALTGLIDASAYSVSFATHKFADMSVQHSKFWFVSGSLLIALIGYGASMAALYLLSRRPDEQRNFSTAVIVNNWASPIVSLFVLPIVFISAASHPVSSESAPWAMVSVLLLGALIFLGTNLLRISFQFKWGRALSYFAATSLVSLICVEGLGRLFGFST